MRPKCEPAAPPASGGLTQSLARHADAQPRRTLVAISEVRPRQTSSLDKSWATMFNQRIK